MSKLEEKLIELNYLYFIEFNGTLFFRKRYFFHTWLVGVNNNINKIEASDFGHHAFNFIAYIRYIKDLKELELCQD